MAMDAGLWSPRRPHEREAAMAIASNAVLAAAGYNVILLLRWRNTLSSGMLTTRFLFPKFFPKKFGQKIGAGPPTGDFGNGLCAGPGPAPPRPPLVQMKDTPGVLPEGRIFQARHSARTIDHRLVGRSAVG
jgi:hypothetical protein